MTITISQAGYGQIVSIEGNVTCERGIAKDRYAGENFRWLDKQTLTWSYRYSSKRVDRLRDSSETMVFTSATSATSARQPNGPGVWKKR